MKNSIFTFFLFAISLSAFAADVKVDKTGAVAGSVTTISAAITAAADGDRIVIFSNGLIYTENLTVNKSLTVLCAAEGEYFFLAGNVTITPLNGREITIVGMHLSGNVASGGVNPVGTRCAVNIVDCEITGTVTFNQDGYDVNLLYNMIWNTTELRYGKVIANKMGNEGGDASSISGFLFITAESATYGTGDTLFIIANRLQKTDAYGNGNNGNFTFDNPNLKYYMANNSIRTGSSSSMYSVNRTGVTIINCYLTDSANVFINNYVSAVETGSSCTGASTYGAVMLKGIKTENFVNNIFKNRYSSSYGCGALGMRGDYNFYDSYRAYPSVTDNNVFNTSLTVSYSYDATIGKANSGAVVDAGKPGINYYDIDLTRADMGTYGGPWSQENYWGTTNPQGGRARVFLLNMPANVYSLTTPVSIKANATHTK